MSLEKLVAEYIKTPLSGNEIYRLCGVQPILYSELSNYKTLEQLLAKTKKPYAIILYQTSSKTDGHYNCIGVNGDGCPYHFDPYGFPDTKIQQLAPYDKKLPNYIDPLLEAYAKKHNKQYQVNTIDFQSKGGGTADCGRWSGLCAILSQFMSFKQMGELFFNNQSSYLRGDNVATLLTLLSLDDIGKYYKNHTGNR